MNLKIMGMCMSTRRIGSIGLVAAGAVGGILISLGITAVAQRGEPLPLRELQQFANVFAAIKNTYVEPLTDQALVNNAIKGLFTDLDPHSAYLDADAFKEMEAMTQGGFGGLGIEIGSEDGMPKVISPIEDTPAARAGILAGDIITHINGKPTKDLSLNDAVKQMRGEPRTSIKLTIRRAGRDKPLEFNLVRDVIKVRSVRSKMLADDVAYVRIAQFQERTAADLVKQLSEVHKGPGAPKGLVIDLRNDPGGLLESAIGVSSAFLDSGSLVVSTKGRIPSSNREYYVKSMQSVLGELDTDADVLKKLNWLKNVPIVVLVNVGSASASEIVAGALQDHKRATIIGNRTFGKGSVQSVVPLSEESGLKLTTALYYTPNGTSIQVTGVQPDVVVDDTAQGNLFRLPREVDLKRHLVNSKVDETTEEEQPDLGMSPEFKMFEFGGDDDFQLQQALNHLAGRPVIKNDPAKVAAAKEAAAKREKEVESESPEKKSPLNQQPSVERFRITPKGLEPVNP
ncbi:Carboxy-terminal processing protease CtpB precursor [Alcaligenes faecalis]|nr:peptidase S41 [Alcaligenes faecalis subsp. faecalis NBRC 13111]CAJ0909812.1 carboxyl-terminal processing protease [Alcaligenes faecalis subsp. faecalis]CUI81193.1 Carboxy-terminal processing protease CtpB precursor [Alcaligenes faecalis]